MPLALSGDGSVGPLSATEVGYLDGVTSAVQTQIDSKLTTPGAWTSYTPTLGNLTLGNGTVSGAYVQIGKTVAFRAYVKFGSTTSFSGGTVNITTPTTQKSGGSTPGQMFFCSAGALDSGVAQFQLACLYADGNTVRVYAFNTGGTYMSLTNLSSTVPFTWATNDEVYVSGIYEAE